MRFKHYRIRIERTGRFSWGATVESQTYYLDRSGHKNIIGPGWNAEYHGETHHKKFWFNGPFEFMVRWRAQRWTWWQLREYTRAAKRQDKKSFWSKDNKRLTVTES